MSTLDSTYYYYDEYIGAIRQDSSKRIYVYLNFINHDELLYDFSLQVGDTIPWGYFHGSTDTVVISSIDSIFDGINFRKQFQLSTSSTLGIDVPSLIEGIGSTFGLMADLEPEIFEMSSVLHCYTQNDSIKFTDSTINACKIIDNNNFILKHSGIKIFQNLFVSQAIIQFDEAIVNEKFELEIYNSIGVLIKREKVFANNDYILKSDELKSGMYLINIYNSQYAFKLKIIYSNNN